MADLYEEESGAPLVRLQTWVSKEFRNLHVGVLSDTHGRQFVRVSRAAPHPLLVTQPSVGLVCRAAAGEGGAVSCQLQSYNSVVLQEIQASFDDEAHYNELKDVLTLLNSQQTSICRGIPEERLLCWANGNNISRIFIERFLSRVVFRERGCSYVMLETDAADICRSCALLLSTSSSSGPLGLAAGDQELACPVGGCTRTFKYQGAMEKHRLRHHRPKTEEEEESQMASGDIKLEPEMDVRGAEEEEAGETDNENSFQNEQDFLDRLLSDLDGGPAAAAAVAAVASGRKKGGSSAKVKRKRKRPATKDFNCSDCDKAFYFQKNLFNHVIEKHGRPDPADEDLGTTNNLKKEFEADEDEDEEKAAGGEVRKRRRRPKNAPPKPVVCDKCGTQFKFASGLYNHRKRMHGDIEKKQCPHCSRMVKSCFLDQHIKEEHGTPRFTCQFCGKGFYYKSFMLNHQKFHTGEFKECICDLCGATYKSVQVLNRHVRNAHQDLRNHKCTHCDKAFHNKQRLERHINSQHTKARVWPCPVCHTRYDRKDNLRTHIRKNHSNVVNPDTVELLPIENDGLDLIANSKKGGGGGGGRANSQTTPSITVELQAAPQGASGSLAAHAQFIAKLEEPPADLLSYKSIVSPIAAADDLSSSRHHHEGGGHDALVASPPPPRHLVVDSFRSQLAESVGHHHHHHHAVAATRQLLFQATRDSHRLADGSKQELGLEGRPPPPPAHPSLAQTISQIQQQAGYVFPSLQGQP